MSQSFITELRQAGIAYDRYRDLARPIQDGHGAARWPLIAATDQLLVAQRWKREALAAPPRNVTQLPSARGNAQGGQASPVDWFASEPSTSTQPRMKSGS